MIVCCSGVMAGWMVWVAPLIEMVAERRGRGWRTRLRIDRPVRFWPRGPGPGR